MADQSSPTKKILLIDDDPGDHVLLETILKQPPPINPLIKLYRALTFDEGIQIIQTESIDLCLLDLNLSVDLQGPETLAKLKSIGIGNKIPVLILTGLLEANREWSHGRLWKEAHLAGAMGYLQKECYLTPQGRPFLLHEIADAMLGFQVRIERETPNQLAFHGTQNSS